MCQLLGVSSNKLINIDFSIKEFRTRGNKNPHGFGFAFYIDGKWEIYKKAACLATQDIQTKEFKRKSKIIIAHVRLLSCGSQSHHNTHPFERANWIFAHNGTLSNFKDTLKLTKYSPVGQTDSEHAFCYLLEKIEEANSLDEQVKILLAESEKITQEGAFNFLLSDGNYLFAFGDTQLFYVERKSPFKKVTLKDTQYQVNLNEIKAPDETAVLIATEQLTENEKWQPLQGLMLFKDGKRVSCV